ncbi:hypothetical protein V6N13_027387 [Hibiscus sabdariffa]|uniref:Uncharacterized protein n=2 Tax=Hibiscus sabdariffa TaxID=183260 RepID=A0ABR2B971_9ROSI
MGNSADCFFGRIHGVDDRPGSRWCESWSRPPLGRRLVRLEGPIVGCRQPCRLRCQDWNDVHIDGGSFRCGKGSCFSFVLQVPVCCFTSADWYGVRGRCNRGLFDGFTLVSVWVFEENSNEGLLVYIGDGDQVLMLVGLWRRSGSREVGMPVGSWGKLFKDDEFLDWEMEMKVLSIEVAQRLCEKGEEGNLADVWLLVIWVWSWWRHRKKRTCYSAWVCRWFRRRMIWISVETVGNLLAGFIVELEGMGSLWFWFLGMLGRQNVDGRTELDRKERWCVAGFGNRGKGPFDTGMYVVLNSAVGRKTDGIVRLEAVWLWWANHDGWGEASALTRWPEVLCFGEEWLCFWWCSWKVRGEFVRGKAFGWWLWRFVWWSTAESKGRKEEFGDPLGYVNWKCMARRGETRSITCGMLGPTGRLISGQVVQWGTFAWRCGVAGLAGGPRLTCGVQRVWPIKYLWSVGCDIRSQIDMKRCVLKGVIRGVLRGEYKGVIRCVLGDWSNERF